MHEGHPGSEAGVKVHGFGAGLKGGISEISKRLDYSQVLGSFLDTFVTPKPYCSLVQLSPRQITLDFTGIRFGCFSECYLKF